VRKIAINAHLKAKKEQFQAHDAYIGAAVQHASYAKGLPEHHERTHATLQKNTVKWLRNT